MFMLQNVDKCLAGAQITQFYEIIVPTKIYRAGRNYFRFFERVVRETFVANVPNAPPKPSLVGGCSLSGIVGESHVILSRFFWKTWYPMTGPSSLRRCLELFPCTEKFINVALSPWHNFLLNSTRDLESELFSVRRGSGSSTCALLFCEWINCSRSSRFFGIKGTNLSRLNILFQYQFCMCSDYERSYRKVLGNVWPRTKRGTVAPNWYKLCTSPWQAKWAHIHVSILL